MSEIILNGEQRNLIKENLVRYFSIHELAEMLIDHFTQDEIDSNLETLCSCETCRVCGHDNADCIACEVECHSVCKCQE